MAKASNNQFPSVLLGEQSSAPTTPSAGTARLYVDNAATPQLKLIDDAATITTFGSGGGTTFSGASVYKSANETGLNSNQTVAWNSEFFDTDTYHDNATNNSRLTVPDTAYYRVSLVMYLYGVDSAQTYSVRLQINATGTEYQMWTIQTANTSAHVFGGSRVFSLTASDYVQCLINTADTNYNIGGAANTSVFEIVKLGT